MTDGFQEKMVYVLDGRSDQPAAVSFRRRNKMKSVILIITAALAGATPLDKRQGW